MTIRPLAGWLLENFGIRRTLVWSGAFSFVGCFFLFFKQSVILLFIGRAVSGASYGVYSAGLLSYQALCVSEKTRGKMFSLLVVGSTLSMASATPLGEWFLLSSRETLYLAVGPVLSALCCLLGGRVGEGEMGEIRACVEKPWGTYNELFSLRPFLLLVITGTTIALVDATIINIPLLSAERGLVASYFLTSSAVAAVVVRMMGSSLINTLPRVVLLAPCGILMAGATILTSLFPTDLVFIAGGTLFGAGIGVGWPMLHALVADFLDPELLPKGSSTALLFYDGGFSAAPLIAGYFLPFLGTAGTFLAVSLASGGLLVLVEIFYWLPLYGKLRSLRAGKSAD